jgi:hypothetical protein
MVADKMELAPLPRTASARTLVRPFDAEASLANPHARIWFHEHPSSIIQRQHLNRDSATKVTHEISVSAGSFPSGSVAD